MPHARAVVACSVDKTMLKQRCFNVDAISLRCIDLDVCSFDVNCLLGSYQLIGVNSH